MSNIFNPGDSAFFQTAGTLHGEKSDTPRVDSCVRARKWRFRRLIAVARQLEKERDAFGREANRLSAENARLRAALELYFSDPSRFNKAASDALAGGAS